MSRGRRLRQAHHLYDANGLQLQGADIDLLRGFFGDVLGDIIMGLAAAVLSAAFVEAISDDGQSNKVLAGIGHFTMGVVAGAVFEVLGRWWIRRGYVRMALFTFRGGACFALGMALLRFAYFKWF